jgi:hypothetical protein
MFVNHTYILQYDDQNKDKKMNSTKSPSTTGKFFTPLHQEMTVRESAETSGTHDITGLVKIEQDENNQYIFPTTPCGVLPFFVNENNKIVWGCVENNRFDVKVAIPPAGTQDIVAIKDNTRLVIEVSKPLKDVGYDFLEHLTGKTISDQNYQDLLNSLTKEGFEVYLEHPLATAIHETQEEHGVDLRKQVGLHHHLLMTLFEFEPQLVLAKRGTTTQKVFVAQLENSEEIILSNTNKIEEKILLNKGREFYEKGIWTTLGGLKLNFLQEKERFNEKKQGSTELNIEATFRAWESRIELIEKIEASITPNLQGVINSEAELPGLKFELVNNLYV